MLADARPRRASAFAVLACLLATVVLATSGPLGVAAPGADAAPENLVGNPSLEAGASWPECFSPSGWGTEATWWAVPGRDGGRAISITIEGYASGDRKLLQTETPECAPHVQEGRPYTLGVWYVSSAAVQLTTFRHDAAGWSYWGDLGAFAATAEWTQAEVTTPPLPAGTDALVFGLSLAADGTLTTDDYSLVNAGAPLEPPSTEPPTPTPTTTPEPTEPRTPTPTEPPPPGPPANLVANPALADGEGTPTCFMLAGWGENIAETRLDGDAPTGSAPGTRAFTIDMSGRMSGDAKLLPSDEAGCAPVVAAGGDYEVSIDYRSSSPANSLTVFQHSADGWSYWTDVAPLPATTGWSTATATLPPIPVGVDRIAFGVSIAADGSLSTTNYELQATGAGSGEPVPTPAPTPTPTPAPGPGDPSIVGAWEVRDAPMPIRTIHTSLLSDGRLLLVAGAGNDGNQFAAGTFRTVVWDPRDDSFLEVPTPYDMFCAGHVTLPDGKVLLSGGTEAYPEQNQGPNTFKGSRKSYYFDPADNRFHPTGDMAGAHWYPTLTKLGNGDLWAAGGLDDQAEGTVLTEMFDTSEMRWLAPAEVPQTWSFWGTYPHMYLLDDGMLFYAGAHTFGNGLPGTGASLYDWRSAQIWDVPGLREKDLRDQAGSVLLPPAQDQRVMIVGGGNTDANVPGINLVDIIDLSVAAPAYEPGPDLPGDGKGYVNVLNLPDRTVLAANGAAYNRAGNIFTAAIYRPAADEWTSVPADPIGRNYHSTAILLPDGRVAVLGSNPADNSFELRISVYSPPYLFRGARPVITAAPGAAGYGEVLEIGVTGEVVSASLMSPMSATHQTDANARLVDLPISGAGATRTAQVPTNPNLLPPGPYMLTVLDADGVPSVAKWVWIS